MTVVLDTNIVIGYLQGIASICEWMEAQEKTGGFAVSTITVVERLGFPRLHPDEIETIKRWFQTVDIIDVDFLMAEEAARLRRAHKTNTADSIIAATAMLLRAPLATRDADFKKIRAIRLIRP